MDPLLSGIGPYNFDGTTTGGLGTVPTLVGNNDLLMAPMIQSYQAQVDGLDALTEGRDAGLATVPSQPVDYTKMYEQMQKMQTQMMDYNLEMQERNRQNQFAINTPYVNIDNAIMVLHEKIVQNEQDQIWGSVTALKEAVRAAYDPDGKMDDATLTAQANSIYMKKVGCTMQDDIRNNGHSSLAGGFLNTFMGGFFGDSVSPEENIARLNGQPESETSKKWRKTGNILGDVTNGAAIGATIGGFCGGGVFSWATAGVGALVGGGVGLVKGILGAIF